MDLLFVVGDQDTFHLGEDEISTSPRWVAELLSQAGLPSLFLLHARRAELLAEDRRHDVIAALRRHEIGLHGRDCHPTLPEIVEGLDWQAGVAAALAVEREELATLARVFEVAPVCSSEHRGYAAPQIFGAAHRLGLPYLFGAPSAPPDYSVSWYAGALNVPFNTPVPNFLGFFPAVFDDVLHDDAAFMALLQQLQAHIARCLAVDLPLLVVFACHPERLGYSGPVELWQYGNGQNHGRAAVPPGIERRHSRAQIARALTNLRRLVVTLRDMPALTPRSVAEIIARYGAVPSTLGRAELSTAASQARATHQIMSGASASPAELMLGLAESVRAALAPGDLPAELRRRSALGPLAPPPLVPGRPWLSGQQLMMLTEQLLAVSSETGHLPAALAVDDTVIGLGAFYGLLAEAYGAAEAGTLALEQAFDLTVWPRYPALALALGDQQRRCVEDPMVRPGLSVEAAVAHTQLQTWTLKPAVRR